MYYYYDPVGKGIVFSTLDEIQVTDNLVIYSLENNAMFYLERNEKTVQQYPIRKNSGNYYPIVRKGQPRPRVTKISETAIFTDEQKKLAALYHAIVTWCDQSHADVADHSFDELIHNQVMLLIVSQLKKLVAEPFSAQRLVNFLKSYWETIKGSAIAYTALPKHSATVFLCDIANQLAAITGKKAINLLMPGIHIESHYEEFKDLDCLPLSEIVALHVLSDHADYLLPVSLLTMAGMQRPARGQNSYPDLSISTPLNEIVNPYCDTLTDAGSIYLTQADWVRLFLHNDAARACLEAKQHYDELVTDKSTLLGRLHILIEKLRQNDVNSGRGTEKVAGSGAFLAIYEFCQYYQKLGDIQQAMPTAVRAAVEKLMALSSEQTKDYEIKRVNEAPSALDAGVIYIWESGGGYCYAVESFKAFTVLLKGELHSIEKEAVLNKLAVDGAIPEHKRFFISQAHLVDTCIATQCGELEKLVRNYQMPLAAIALSASSKEAALNEMKTKYACGIQQLAGDQAIFGKEHRPLTDALLRLLNIELETYIAGAQLSDIMLLSEQELQVLLHAEKSKKAFFEKVGNEPDEWVLFVHNYHATKVACIFDLLSAELSTVVIKTARDLLALLISLTDSKLRAVLAGLSGKVTNIIKTENDFKAVLSYLASNQCTAVCEALKDYFLNIIKTADDFSSVLENLTSEQCTAVYEAMKERLPQRIKTAHDFRSVLENLTSEQRTAVYEAVKEYLPQLIKIAYDFNTVLLCLTPKQCTAVYEAVKERLPNIIKTAGDFNTVLLRLTPKQRTAVYEAMKERLPQLIETAYDFSSVLENLTSEQRAAVYEAVKEYLPQRIKKAHDFNAVLVHLTPKQRTAVYEAVKGRLPNIIKTVDDFKTVLSGLAPELCTAVCEALEDYLPQLIETVEDFKTVLSGLAPELCTAVCEALKDYLPQRIKTAHDFRSVLENLTSEQRTAVYEAVKGRLPNIIKTAGDFITVLKGLAPELCTAVCEALKDYLPQLIETVENFKTMLSGLAPDRRTAVCEAVKASYAHLPEKIIELLYQGIRSRYVNILLSDLKIIKSSHLEKYILKCCSSNDSLSLHYIDKPTEAPGDQAHQYNLLQSLLCDYAVRLKEQKASRWAHYAFFKCRYSVADKFNAAKAMREQYNDGSLNIQCLPPAAQQGRLGRVAEALAAEDSVTVSRPCATSIA